MLRELSFTNFKTWDRADVSFGKITAFFGTNSSGKSSLIQFLLLLKQTKEATDRAIALDLNGPYVSLGAYKDMIYGHEERRRLEWKLVFERQRSLPSLTPQKSGLKVLCEAGKLP
jgi:predicted ATPase